jgi:tRNA G18 (ribose-2'-O)-methylase SpoU
MPTERVESLDDPRLADYRHLPDPELLRRGEIFVAEGRLVVRALLTESPLATRSVLVTENARRALADVLEPRAADLAVFLVAEGTIEALTGFNIHRGCLAIGERPTPEPLPALLARLPGARRLVVLEQVANADNLGGIFRNAAAFGADAVVLGPACCDPLYRKAIRVSMGAALRVPFCHAGDWQADLGAIRAAGFTLAALTPSPDAVDIGDWASAVPPCAPVALMAGSEGSGLSGAALARADVSIRIPMASGTDSLNVATATGIALHACFRLAGDRAFLPGSARQTSQVALHETPRRP